MLRLRFDDPNSSFIVNYNDENNHNVNTFDMRMGEPPAPSSDIRYVRLQYIDRCGNSLSYIFDRCQAINRKVKTPYVTYHTEVNYQGQCYRKEVQITLSQWQLSYRRSLHIAVTLAHMMRRDAFKFMEKDSSSGQYIIKQPER